MSASEIDVHVGLRMRRRREALGISQGRLGRHLGLTFSQIQKYEKGTNRIGAGRLYQIASLPRRAAQPLLRGARGTSQPVGADGRATAASGATSSDR